MDYTLVALSRSVCQIIAEHLNSIYEPGGAQQALITALPFKFPSNLEKISLSRQGPSLLEVLHKCCSSCALQFSPITCLQDVVGVDLVGGQPEIVPTGLHVCCRCCH